MGLILDRATSFAANGVIGAQECGKLVAEALKDGKISYGERTDLLKVQTTFADQLTPKARAALNNFLALGNSFDGSLAGKIFGVDDDKAEFLEKAGVTTVAQLLARTRTPSDRKKLAKDTTLDKLEITDFAERADLARVLGLGKKYASALEKMGINNVQTLANQDADTLYTKISDFLKTDTGKKYAKRAPSKSTVEKWVDNAQILPFVLRYAGDSGANFTKVAFNALSDDEKGRLIMGMDVAVSGNVFDADTMTVEAVSRRPSEIKKFVDDAEADAAKVFKNYFDYEVENGVVFNDIKRIKIGDDTVGYRVAFDVNTTDDQNYGWEGGGDMPEFGASLTVALDPQGKIMSVDLEDTYDRYGGAEWNY